jgi:hypothetical protein
MESVTTDLQKNKKKLGQTRGLTEKCILFLEKLLKVMEEQKN